MKEFFALLEYIDIFTYDEEKEETVARLCSKQKQAKEAYNNALSAIKEDKEEITIKQKWMLDVAIDFVRMLPEEDRYYLSEYTWISSHIGWLECIKNRYVSKSEKVISPFDDDETSQDIMKYAFSILSWEYDFRNEEYVRFHESEAYSLMFYNYHRNYPEQFRETDYMLLEGNPSIGSFQAEELLQEKLLEKVGQDEFTKRFKHLLGEYFEKLEDYRWQRNHSRVEKDFEKDLFDRCILFPDKCEKVIRLKEDGLFDKIERFEIKSFEECRHFVDSSLEENDPDAEFLTNCIWEAFSDFKESLPWYEGEE